MTKEDLISPLPHDLAVEYGRRGGLAGNKKAKSWHHQIYCNDKCVHYSTCPAITTSMQLPVIVKGTKKHHPCFIRKAPIEIRNLYENLFENGEEGLIKDIMSVLFRLRMESLPKADGRKPTMKELREVIETSCQVKKAIYGDKSKTEITGKLEAEIKTLNINVEVKKYIHALDQLPDINEEIIQS